MFRIGCHHDTKSVLRMSFLRLLRVACERLSPEERLVLASFAMHFEGCGPVQMTQRELSGRLGISMRVVARAVSRLSAEAHLVVDKVSVGRGRPSSTYELSAMMQARLNDGRGESYPLVCEQAIKNLLSAKNEQSGKGYGGTAPGKSVGFKKPPSRSDIDQPSASARWLLAVLFSYSDELGVVRGTTTSELRRATGMGRVKLKSQLQSLVDRGVIRNCIPGASNTLFVGTKVSTTYFLNLNHPFLGLDRDASAILALKEGGCDRRDLVCVTAPPIVERFLRGIEGQAFEVFCLRVDEYASFLLTNHWAELSNPRCPELTKLVEGMVSADFQRPDGNAADGAGVDEATWAMVVEHIGWLALYRAGWIRELVIRMPSGGVDKTRIQISPAPKMDDEIQVTVLLMERSPVPQVNCLLFNFFPPPCVCSLYGEEAEIPVDERYDFGLLTRPKG